MKYTGFAKVRILLFGLSLAGMLAWSDSPAADPAKGLLPDAEYAKFIAQQSKVVVDAIKLGKDNKIPRIQKREAGKARAAAVMIAVAAQDNLTGPKAGERAGLRDAALAVAKLLNPKVPKFAEALKQAEALSSFKGKAKPEKIKIFDVHTDLEEIMTPFKPTRSGGLGIESNFLKISFSKKKIISAKYMTDSLRLGAYQTALIAEMTKTYKPDKDVKKWQALSDDMRDTALELAAKVQAKDGKGGFKVLTKLNDSCTQCHKIFRD